MSVLNQLGVQLVWGALQVTLLLVVAVGLFLAARGRGPATRSWIAASALLVALVMLLAAASPWPRWWSLSIETSVAQSAEAAEEVDTVQLDDGTLLSDDAAVSAASAERAATAGVRGVSQNRTNPLYAALSGFVEGLRQGVQAPVAGQAAARWTWPGVVAALFLAGVGVGILRLGIGLWAVRRYRRTAVTIDDPRVLAEVSELSTRIGERRAVSVCESADIGTPATIGWRRPLVLLPADWRSWDDCDRRAVLAHELGHVARGDYLTGLVARLTTALHFYHPLVHWLARRMRFEQELAADACGVRHSAGKESYVVALARLALYQDNRALAWAARPFLPTRSTFLRRIEMLRNTKQISDAPLSRGMRRMLIVGLALVGFAIAGLRGPMHSADGTALAQNSSDQKISLANVPEDTVVYAVIRPATILARDSKLREAVLTMERQIELNKNAGISPSEVEEFRLMVIDLTVPGQRVEIEPVMIVRTTKAEGWKSLVNKIINTGQADHLGQKYTRVVESGEPRGPAFFSSDEKTLVIATKEAALKAYIEAVKSGGNAPQWADEFKRVEGGDAALAVDARFFGKIIEAEMKQPDGNAGMMTAFAPLWRQTNTLVAGAKLDGTIKAEAHAICKSEAGAEEVRATATAARVLAQNMLPVARREMAGGQMPPELVKLQNDMLDQAEKFLAQVKPESDGKVVTVKVEGSEAFGPMVAGVLLPALAKARATAQYAQSTNNLKQIALAMHNYASVHGQFPPAVVLGPDGKTPHSWRVAILPYLEQDSLYKTYNFSEPWDSDNNKKLLAQMPAVYRHPNATDVRKDIASYYVLTGEGGIFNDQPATKGTGFEKIRDGTSNTLLLVEAKRDIPWTKPEDIPFDAQKPPELGGFTQGAFAIAIADGSVHTQPPKIDANFLKSIFTISGNEPVDVHPAPQGAGAAKARPPVNAVVPPPETKRGR
jgi:beta-lactamase regulating signal transducer with metallopeptidase domain